MKCQVALRENAAVMDSSDVYTETIYTHKDKSRVRGLKAVAQTVTPV